MPDTVSRGALPRLVRLPALARTLLAFTALTLAGCVNTSLTSDVDPNVDLDTLKHLYVLKLPADERGIDGLIADRLGTMGYQVEHGDTAPAPDAVDALVTYQDQWMWDITMYMLTLRVQLRDPDTDYVLASGQVHRTSLARRPPEEMVEEVLSEIFKSR
ncbi:hypothetical protein E4634_14140 [Mangrovimicrobium sediminis]|uniref:DUF4136 domain-containing protein n=1 Tax=Mangrovimicrobium sediminis TaxID=2562682 RepID=A0A4Z0LZS4_9GAMM|nr:hypothetical protein [Haliea sp. SAOS-164]TGD72657.1 hypothetical protein E4634_14140 [Haliea sp. SAOS-164]